MIDPTRQPGIRIAQIFLERATFEHRPDFLSLAIDTPVNAEIDLQLQSGVTQDETKGRIQITVSSRESDESLYRFAFLMTALVEAEEEANFPLPEYVRANAFGMLFPFVRELVANVTSRGRFGPLWLKPVNLVAIASQGTPVQPAAGSVEQPSTALLEQRDSQ